MSKSKKVSNPQTQVEELYKNFKSNINKTIELNNQLDTLFTGIFKPNTKSVDTAEINGIYKEFLENMNFIDNVKDAIEKISKENSTVIKNISKILVKSLKGVDSGAEKEMSKLQAEYLKNQDKIAQIEQDLQNLNKDRTGSIKKAYMFMKKNCDTKATKETKETKGKKVSVKDSKVASPQKKMPVKEKKLLTKLKQETSDSESDSQVKKKMNTLVIDESESDGSESETDSNVSYVESGSDDESNNESDDSEEED
tara:strand:+ start:585 stop:1346 length:762 start_codon:yes stop_codon:yes gene_type:complete